MQRLTQHLCGLLWACVLVGCSGDAAPGPASMSSPDPHPLWAATTPAPRRGEPPSDDAALILPDLMDWLVDPAAEVVFAAAERRPSSTLEPLSDAAWQAVVDAASEVVRTGELLAQPALAGERPDWLQWVAAMRESSLAAAAAARRHDAARLFAAGQDLRATCLACHARHARLATQAGGPLAPGRSR